MGFGCRKTHLFLGVVDRKAVGRFVAPEGLQCFAQVALPYSRKDLVADLLIKPERFTRLPPGGLKGLTRRDERGGALRRRQQSGAGESLVKRVFGAQRVFLQVAERHQAGDQLTQAIGPSRRKQVVGEVIAEAARIARLLGSSLHRDLTSWKSRGFSPCGGNE